jgi:formylglycine-generating enzyme required for sulfatase activity
VSARTWFRLVGLLALLVALSFALSGWTKAPAPFPRRKQPKEISNSIGMRLVVIPKGKFTMGSPNPDYS